MPTTDRPLEDLRVLDLTDARGDLCARLLGDLGADVLRVEPPGGVHSRRFPPYGPDGRSLHFAYRNTNKRSTVLDLGTPEGRISLLALVAEADVLVESFRPGALADLGIGPTVLLNLNPELVVASLTDFGQTGPDRELLATDDVLVAMSGWLALSGIPEKPPLLPPGSLASDVLGVMGAYAIILGLIQASRGGGGQHLDVSALEAVAQLNTWGLPNSSHSLARGSAPQVLRSGDSPMYPTIPCADGHVRQVVMAPGQWRALWEWMGSPEAFADEYWESFFNRLTNLDILNPMFEGHWATIEMLDGCREAQARGIVATPMLSPADILAEEHFDARGSFVHAEVALGTEAPVIAGFWEVDGERVGYRFRAPEVGEHGAIFAGPRFRVDGRPGEPPDMPLRGLRVADFGHGGVGVECGRMLAEYGADVVKVESHAYPDFIRIFLGSEMTPSFASSSRTKRCLGLDLKHPDAAEVLDRLVGWADVIVENNSTGTIDELGLGWEDVHALNPRLVMVSSQLMGSRGPLADWTGYGPTIQTVGGLSWLWAFDDGDGPPGSNAIHPDHLAGRICALGALAALIGLNRGGSGAHVEVAQVEALMGTLGDLFLSESLTPGSARPEGNDSPMGAPWGVYACAGDEQWCVVCVRDDVDWMNLRHAMENPAWAGSTDLDSAVGRLAARDRVNAGVSSWTATMTPLEVQNRCQAAMVPAGRLMNTVDQLEDPHLEERGFLVRLDQPGLGPVVLEGACITGSGMAGPVIGPAPFIGEHTRRFCVEDLGMDPDRVEELIATGAMEAVDVPNS
ncbi:MAG: CoA transferase [Actinomycetota bacterium]|nr:CoA transferase [Actinomycetota bacterium]